MVYCICLILTCDRQSLDQPNEKGLPLFSVEDTRTQHWGRWQDRAIESVNVNGWTPKNKQHVEEFSRLVDAFIISENEAHFRNEMFANLHFDEQDDRLHSINAPHENTFQWILEPRYQKDSKLLEWLGATGGQNLFWLTGKNSSQIALVSPPRPLIMQQANQGLAKARC